jgi:hypothetical protein
MVLAVNIYSIDPFRYGWVHLPPNCEGVSHQSIIDISDTARFTYRNIVKDSVSRHG